jgi:hypothetical protein
MTRQYSRQIRRRIQGLQVLAEGANLPRMTPLRILAFVLLAVAAAAGCQSCCQGPRLIGPKTTCELGKCEQGDAFRFGSCQPGGCSLDTDCCPGTRCRTDVNTCSPLLLDPDYSCTTDADCKDPAQKCIATKIGDRDPLPTCVYQLCNGDSDCGFGRICYQGRCEDQAPCGGTCPSGTACDLVTSKCAPFPKGSDGCDKTCGVGQLKLFTDPNTMSGEACCPLACECTDLPPIVPSRFGRYSRVVVAGGEAQVSAYDAEFGDLVLVHFKLDGTLQRLDYLDGVPTNGTPTALPTGPRGGITDPGPNVGTHTSIAADANGLVRIAYRDEDGKSVKVAIQQPDKTFKTYFLDGGDTDADFGRYTDIAVDASNNIYVTYLAHNATLAGVTGRGTGIKIAKSNNANPLSASDWTISVVDARPIFDACNGACTTGQTCVLNGGAAQCLSAGTGCNPSCTGVKTCMNTGTDVQCLPPPLPPEDPDFPRGRGLYTSVAMDGTTPIIAYYDAIDGDLRVVAGIGGTPVVLDGDGQNGHSSGDVGRFPTVAKLGSNITIAYEDFGRHEVRAWQGAQTDLGTGGTYTLVERGQIPNQSGKVFVGAGARLAKDHALPILVYQDASNLDLKRADFDGTAWAPQTVLKNGAHGFYSDVAVSGGKAYIVSVQAQLDARGQEASRLGLTVQPAP